MYYVYTLRCSNRKLYTGCTSDINERLARHNNGYVTSTQNIRPVNLITYTAFSEKHKAFEFEKYLKTGSGRALTSKHLV